MNTRSRKVICFVVGAVLMSPVWADPMPRMRLQVGNVWVDAELAATERDRVTGLMRRAQLGPDQGMLFVFPARIRACMWMKDTLLPLSVAFILEDGRIANIEDMAPGTQTAHCATAPVRYALEMNRGWFARHRIAAGERVSGLTGLGGGGE